MDRADFEKLPQGAKVRMVKTLEPGSIPNGSIGETCGRKISGLVPVQFTNRCVIVRFDEVEPE